jgi:hypothetical protein
VAVGDLRGDWKLVYLERKRKIEPDGTLLRYALTINGMERLFSRNVTNTDGQVTSHLRSTPNPHGMNSGVGAPFACQLAPRWKQIVFEILNENRLNAGRAGYQFIFVCHLGIVPI